MSDDKIEKELELPGHSYDGIEELDNPLPGWWLWTFLFTIIFAFHYFIHYELGGGPSLKQELASAMNELEKNAVHEPEPTETEEALAIAMSGHDMVRKGAEVYSSKCLACHGANLQGQVGPNLTDKFWIHGQGSRTDIVKVVRAGVPDKGMPNWGQIISKEDVYAVSAFILSKKDSNPPNPKAPQGQPVN
jgi:cytochrome c oxidase cbb3-type subunit 3